MHPGAAIVCFLVGVLAAPASAATPVRWVVRVTDVRALHGLVPVTTVADDTFVVRAPAPPAGPGVVWAVADTRYSAARLPSDPCYLACPPDLDGQAELRTVRAPEAWDVTTGSPTITVAVLDTLADVTHPDLVGKVVRGPDFATERCDGRTSAAGHGTAVAGLVGARTDDARGMASLGWQTRVLSIGVLDDCGLGTASAVALGIRHAVEAGARVVNLSLSGDSSPVVGDAVAFARRRGVLVVAAAGNEGSSALAYPAAYPGVLAVGSTDTAATAVSSFSNTGPWVDLVAPGEDVLSTAPGGGYGSFTGTSFAAPMVAAAAALVLARHPGWDGDDVTVRLVRSARRVADVAPAVLDAGAAVTERPGGAVEAAADGSAFAFGQGVVRGSAASVHPVRPVVGVATAGNGGYWLVASDGGVLSFGSARFLGSTGGRRLNRPIVGMAATPRGDGYWLVASDGGVFSFGSARFLGSTGGRRLNRPIVGMAATPTGDGYWLVASDGGIFSFGDARFAGSTGSLALRAPIVGMAAASASSYWLVAGDGGLFAFGGAPFLGSAAGTAPAAVTGMAAGPGGYWLATADGHLLPFGTVPDAGSVHPRPRSPIVGVAGTS